MQLMQRTMLFISYFTTALLFAIFGCQTTYGTVDPQKKPVPVVKSEPVQADVENTAVSLKQTTSTEKVVKKEVVTEKTSDSNKKRVEAAHKRLESLLGGHGGGRKISKTDTEGPAVDTTIPSKALEDRPFLSLEKKLYGKWINNKETESYDFRDDGKVTIVVIGKSKGSRKTLKGHYRLVEEGRIEFDFKGGPYARVIPVRHFKITISDDEFSLTDEPNRHDGSDGPTTIYNRVR